MNDTPVDAKIKEGLKVQAKCIACAILNSLVEADHKPVPDERIKNLADVAYTVLYSFHYQEESSSAYEFLKLCGEELRYCDWKAGFVDGFEG
jgi:hypothetical protein